MATGQPFVGGLRDLFCRIPQLFFTTESAGLFLWGGELLSLAGLSVTKRGSWKLDLAEIVIKW
jgi:hypothetical protein